MSRKAFEEKKIKVLSKICENKHILFGPFSDSVTKINKSDKWQEICVLAKRLNIISDTKEWTYIRDVFWQNCKRGAFAKLDNAKKINRKYRTDGVEDCNLNSCDNMVFNIVGRKVELISNIKDEPSLDLIDSDSATCKYDDDTPPSYSESVYEHQMKMEDVDPCKSGITSPSVSVSQVEPKPILPGRKRLTNTKKRPTVLKKRKLMIEHLKLINYKTRLEIALLEKKLSYPPSVYTKSFADATTGNISPQDSSSDHDTEKEISSSA